MDSDNVESVVIQSEEIVDSDEHLKIKEKRSFIHLALQSWWSILTVLATALASAGTIYLALHPQLIWNAINYPYAIGFVFAVPVAIFLILLVFRFFATIKQFLQIQIEKIRKDTQSHWFTFAIVCFIIVSMAESGTFFGSSIKNLLFGYFTVFAIDVCAVQFANSRKKALMHSDEKQATWYMIGVFVTALPSAFANVYSSINNFDLPKDKVPHWMGSFAPYVGFIFPMLIVFLTYTLDAEISSKGIVERFEDEQNTRIRLLEAKERAETKRLVIQERLELLKQKNFFLKSIFFPKSKLFYIADLAAENASRMIETKTDEYAIPKLIQVVNKKFDEIEVTPYDDKYIRTELLQLKKSYLSKTEELDQAVQTYAAKMQDYDAKLTRAATIINQLRQSLPQIIETKVQEIQDQQQYELVAERVFMRLAPNITTDLQKQLETKITQNLLPQSTIVSEIEHIDQEVREQQENEEQQDEQEWKVVRLTAKSAGYKSKEKQCTIGAYRFAKFDLASTIFTSSKITEQVLEELYNQKLLPAKYFRIIEVTAWGGEKRDHILIAVYPDTQQLQKMILEKIKILKTMQI